jgi:hypothetical protein
MKEFIQYAGNEMPDKKILKLILDEVVKWLVIKLNY